MCCDCERPAAYAQRTRKARKEHKCCECGRTINRGEKYDYVSGIWESEPSSFKTCAHCAATRTIASRLTGYSFHLQGLDVELEEAKEHIGKQGEKFLLWRMFASLQRQWRTKQGRLMAIPEALS